MENPYKPRVPYPAHLNKELYDKQFAAFMKVLNNVHVDMPFVKVVKEMPHYAKFMKDLVTNKRKLPELLALAEEETAELNEEVDVAASYNEIDFGTLPRKRRDTGPFTLPCKIGNTQVSNGLADTGASINVMSYSLANSLGLIDFKPTRMNIKLADKSATVPRGILEDVQLTVGKYTFLTDFVVIDAHSNMSLILGRPFLNTAKAIIDISNGTITLRVGLESATFRLSSAGTRQMADDDLCSFDETVTSLSTAIFTNLVGNDPLEKSIVSGMQDNSAGTGIDEEVASMTVCQADGVPAHDRPILVAPVAQFKTSYEEPPDLELKELPPTLEYAFLEDGSKLQVIINSTLSPPQKASLVALLKQHKQAIAWKVTEIKGISPTYCKHQIYLEEDEKPVLSWAA